MDELADVDLDLAIACADCNDGEPTIYPCACEGCINTLDDDCDSLADGADPDCVTYPYCVIVASGVDPQIEMGRGACDGASISGPFDIIRAQLERIRVVGDSLDLGNVACVDGGLTWDRVTDVSADPNPACNEVAAFYLARNTGNADFGDTTNGETRDTMTPDSPCP
jgi:hypothetical protein